MSRKTSRRTSVVNEPILQYYHNQDFAEIRNLCLEKKVLFEDPYFKMSSEYKWVRPLDLVAKPQLIVDGVSLSGIIQGELGDDWMTAAITTLAQYPQVVKRVLPANQDFSLPGYVGVFHFRFWQFDKWCDVVVDDRLPTVDGRLAFIRSATPNEFWPALYQKAYCKVLGDFYALTYEGNQYEALEDFTGGVVEQFTLGSITSNFKDIFLHSIERHSLVSCFFEDSSDAPVSRTSQGLVSGHYYSVVDAKTIDIRGSGKTVLVCLRDPLSITEWKGAWSYSSPEWKSLSESKKKELGPSRGKSDFWMLYDDLRVNFLWVNMCHIGLSQSIFGEAQANTSEMKMWNLNVIRDNWVPGVTSGGAQQMHGNPQIRFVLKDPDTKDSSGECSVLIALTQKTRAHNLIEHYNEIGFKVYRLKNHTYDNKRLDLEFFNSNKPETTAVLKKSRKATGRFNVKPGAYCVIPFTYEPGIAGEFLVRIYSEKKTETNQVEQSVGVKSQDVTTEEVHPMRESDNFDILKKYFQDVSNGTNEVGWRGLKKMLTIAMEVTKPGYVSGFGGALVSVVTFFQRIFVTKVPDNAFETIGPQGFCDNSCRNMVTMVDDNHSGKIDFEDFRLIWDEIMKWKTIYENFSKNTGGYLMSSDLQNCLEMAGYSLNNRNLGDIVHRYATDDGKIEFDQFLTFTLKIKLACETFRCKKVSEMPNTEYAFDLEEFVGKAMNT